MNLHFIKSSPGFQLICKTGRALKSYPKMHEIGSEMFGLGIALLVFLFVVADGYNKIKHKAARGNKVWHHP